MKKESKPIVSEKRRRVFKDYVLNNLHQFNSSELRPISANGVIAKILGRIDTVENDAVHLSAAKSNAPLGEANFTEFPITDSAFEYLDAAHTPEPLRNKLK